MASITTQPITSISVWESFMKKHKEANFLQSWHWGAFHEALGKTVYRTGFYEHDELIGVMLSVVEPAKRGKYLTVPAGPVIDWRNKKVIDAAFDEMQRIGEEERCVFVRIRPQLIEDDFSKKIFAEHGAKSAQMHLHAELTSRLDLSRSDEDLLSQMRKSTRYEIRKAEKIGVELEISRDVKDVKKFYAYQLETAKRQKFVPFSYKFLYEQFKVFFEADKALLYTAKFEKKILAQAFVIFYGDEAVYHYGVGTDAGRRFPGAYLIQWQAIREAKKRGMRYYNFWGVAAEEDKTHRFYTISIFKRGFGGVDTQYLHAQDLVIDSTRYLINFAIEKLRKMVRRV